MQTHPLIFTIGHSTRDLATFLQLLSENSVDLLIDVRRAPGSKRHPQFNAEPLRESLAEQGIQYLHLEGLGGRRSPRPDSQNVIWRNEAFRGYADYMQTGEFLSAVGTLEEHARNHNAAVMCAEAPWWRCHRALISDYLKAKGWKVMHILELGKTEEHPFTSPARVIEGRLEYPPDGTEAVADD